MNCYLDIETTGLDPLQSKIITIQYIQLERNTAMPVGPLKILKEWESDEKTILKKFISDSGVGEKYPFAFIPVGYNLEFEHKFFWQRCMSNALQPVDILNRPFLDLKTVGVIMNRGEFKGASLNKLTNKPRGGGGIPQLYAEKKYGEIESYIRREAEEFTTFCSRLYEELPRLLDKFKQS